VPQAIQNNAIERIYQKTDWTLANVLGNPIIGADGTTNTSDATVLPIFDLRSYRSTYIYLYSDGYAGATALALNMWHFDVPSPHPGTFKWVGLTGSQNVPPAGGGATIITTDSQSVYADTGSTKIAGVGLTIAPRVLFCQFQLVFTGTISALTSLRMSIYGIR
jgi:hypothetical protein